MDHTIRISRLLLVLGALSGLMACSKHYGALTIINPHEKTVRGALGEEVVTIEPGKHWTKEEVPRGEQPLTLSGAEPTVAIEEHRTTVIDLGGTNCYVVADFRPQYGENPKAEIELVERFLHKKTFSPKDPLVVPYDRKLPKRIPEGTAARRLHQVDCAIAQDNQQVMEAIMRVP